MIFGPTFHVFCEAWCVAWQCKNHRFALVFTMFGGHHPFYKKQKNVVKMGDVFREACRHHFFIDFSRFWPPFWEGFGHQNWKKHGSERCEKTVKKNNAKHSKSHAGVCVCVQARGAGVPYKYPPRRPTSPSGAPTSLPGTSKAS